MGAIETASGTGFGDPSAGTGSFDPTGTGGTTGASDTSVYSGSALPTSAQGPAASGGSDPWSLVLGGAAAGGISAIGSYLGASQTNDANASEITQEEGYNTNAVAESQAFQNYMRGTAYQTSVNDLKAAGLNPILAANNGATATPGTATASSPGVIPNQNAIGQAVSSGLQGARTVDDLITAKQNADTARASQLINANLAATEATKNLATAKQVQASTDYTAEQTKLAQMGEGSTAAKAAFETQDATWRSEHYGLQKAVDMLSQITGGVNSASQAYGSAMQGLAAKGNAGQMNEKAAAYQRAYQNSWGGGGPLK